MRMLLAQTIALLIRLLSTLQHGPLSALRMQFPLLPIPLNDILIRYPPLTPPSVVVVIVLDIAQRTDQIPPSERFFMLIERTADFEEFTVVFVRCAVFASGREAGGCGVCVCGAEVAEDVGGVLVGVVVFELEDVGFAAVSTERRRLSAEAKVAGQDIAGVGGGTAGETFDLACFELGGSEGMDGIEKKRESYDG